MKSSCDLLHFDVNSNKDNGTLELRNQQFILGRDEARNNKYNRIQNSTLKHILALKTFVFPQKTIQKRKRERERRNTNRQKKKTDKSNTHLPVINENKSPSIVTLKHLLLPKTSKDHKHKKRQKIPKQLGDYSIL